MEAVGLHLHQSRFFFISSVLKSAFWSTFFTSCSFSAFFLVFLGLRLLHLSPNFNLLDLLSAEAWLCSCNLCNCLLHPVFRSSFQLQLHRIKWHDVTVETSQASATGCAPKKKQDVASENSCVVMNIYFFFLLWLGWWGWRLIAEW